MSLINFNGADWRGQPGRGRWSRQPQAAVIASLDSLTFWLVVREPACALSWVLSGAGDGNRTRTTSLEGWGSSR